MVFMFLSLQTPHLTSPHRGRDIIPAPSPVGEGWDGGHFKLIIKISFSKQFDSEI
jgi:hypothetical protein